MLTQCVHEVAGGWVFTTGWDRRVVVWDPARGVAVRRGGRIEMQSSERTKADSA